MATADVSGNVSHSMIMQTANIITYLLPNEMAWGTAVHSFLALAWTPAKRCAGDLLMLVGSSCPHTSDLKTPVPSLHAIHITENRDFCPYMDAGLGGAWWELCSASCPAQHGSTCTTFHKLNIHHMAPCLWLCSVELVHERKRSEGTAQTEVCRVFCSLFFCLLSPFNAHSLSSGILSSSTPPCTVCGGNRASARTPKVRKNLQHTGLLIT